MSEANLKEVGVSLEHDPFGAGQVERVVPTTEAQREIWLADQLGTEASLAYNESASLWFAGTLDAAALDSALALLGERHEALNATVGPDGTELWIYAATPMHAEKLDFSALEVARREQALAAERVKAVETRFDVASGPLVRVVLMRSGDQQHELMITAHHIVCDGWSLGVLAEELMAIYRAFAAGQPLMLDPAPRFGDHALTQRQPQALQQQADDERYWVGQYDRSMLVLDLPGDRSRNTTHRSFASRRELLVIEPTLTEAVRRNGARAGASLFATLFSFYAALLARLAGVDELVIGVPAAGQPSAGLPGLVGHCVQLLPVRVGVDMERGADAHIGATRGLVLDAYEHQACTFGSLLKKLQIERDPARLPLVSVLFNLDAEIDTAKLSTDDLQVRVVGNPRHFENFELFLNVAPIDGGLRLECQYNTSLFDAATVRRWLALYRSALERYAAEPNIALVAALAPAAEEQTIVAGFNATGLEHDRSLRVDTLFGRQAGATPDAVAVVSASSSMSYRELDTRANALAADLQERGVGPGELIGLYCDRNEHMLVALLGVLKSGAGYVPLDPGLPVQRLEFMAQDAGLRFVVSELDAAAPWPFGATQRVAVAGLTPRAAAPASTAGVDDVAYVIYTSGSTGTPKGVRVPHRCVVNLLASLRTTPAMRATHRVLSVTTLSFDIAVSELIMPLTVGARIVLATRAQAMDGEQLRHLIERENVDFIDGTPSTWQLLLAAGWPGRRDLLAICTGEPLPPELGSRLLPLVGELWNGYGPTETTVWSSFHRVDRIDGPVAIGRPIANTQIHVADSRLRALPLGAIGELYIAGEGVTLGYLNRPELTEERFVPAPPAVGGVPSTRWYRTGDLGRWRPDGVLECLGRIDHQVKVRGYRIELGEIEAALVRHPALERVLVITREDQPGDVRLVAYVIACADFEEGELRKHLVDLLPAYMIPQHFVRLSAIPALPNGKLDRRALPKPTLGVAARHQERVAPAGETEQRVLAAMESVLDLPGLSTLDNFFAMGGHSLLAVRLTTRLNSEFGIALPLRTLFEAPTARALSAAVERAPRCAHAQRRVIVHQRDESTAPMTMAQERIRFLEELQPGRVLFNTPSAHRLTGLMDVAVFEQALRAVVRRQSVLRTRIVPSQEGQGHVQRIEDDIDFSLPFEDLSGVPEAERELELLARMQVIVDTPIPINTAPLFRVALWKLSAEQHAFLFMPHHIIWDGWSFDILYAEMSAAYGALSTGVPVTLAAPAITFADYSRWFADWLKSPECDRQLHYWKQRFARLPMPKALVTDKPRHPGMSGVGATEWVHVDPAFTARLRDVARRHDLTLSMLTMAVYAAMMATAVGGSSIVIGLPVRGRLSPETEGVMGFFNNLLPVQLELNPTCTLGEFLGTVKRDTLDAFEHQEIPFERLAVEPEISSRTQRVGLYQALFSFQDARDRERKWGSLRQQGILIFQKGATEDLGLWLLDGPDGLDGGFTYNADIYLPETAAAFRERYLELLRRIADDPSLSVSEFTEAGASAPAKWLGRLAGGGIPVVTTSPEPAPGVHAKAHVDLSSDNERALAKIWASLLDIDIDQVSPSDNFFDLGGDSLLAMRAVESAGRSLGFRIDARRYFYENLAQLANADAAVTIAAAGATATVHKEVSAGLFKRVFGAFGRQGRK